MKNIILYTCFIGFTMLLLTGCDDFVEVDMPPSQLTAEGIFQNTSTANAAMANVYAGLRDNGLITGKPSGISSLIGGYADELDYYGQPSIYNEYFFDNTLLASDDMVESYWTFTYSQIYACNAVIEGVSNASPIPEADRDRLRGEALFMRAWLHFYLTNLFGDIPYVITTDYTVNAYVSRIPVSEVYNSIIADLQQSIELLPTTYSSIRRIKPNRWVAEAFLSRVYLYSGAFTLASETAGMVINNTSLFNLNPNVSSVFLRASTETIWQLQPVSSTANTSEGATFIFLQGPPPSIALSPELMAGFEAGDLRKDNWTLGVSNGVQIWYHAYKYKQQSSTSTSQENSIMIRLAELLLIRAEANARLGNLAAAQEDINTIRQRAGLPVINLASQEQVLDAILQERRIELFTELGHRFFDLKRFGVTNAVLSPLKPNWSNTDVVLPIPENELLRNTNLGSQNPGY